MFPGIIECVITATEDGIGRRAKDDVRHLNYNALYHANYT